MTDATTRYFAETPCPDCGQPWILRGTGTTYHWYQGKRCYGPGPSRIEVTAQELRQVQGEQG